MSVFETSRDGVSSAALSPFPVVTPGQLWLIELPVGSALSAQAQHVLDGADVVIYDRELTDTVADRKSVV